MDQPRSKVLLVGEDNPYGSDPRYALYPYPAHSAGGRLCHKLFKMHPHVYIRVFSRVNLCSQKWGIQEARETAQGILRVPAGSKPVVLFGSKVAQAFGIGAGVRWLGDEEAPPMTIEGHQIFLVPHPSGRNRIWNDPKAQERAWRILRKVRNFLDCVHCGAAVDVPDRLSPSVVYRCYHCNGQNVVETSQESFASCTLKECAACAWRVTVENL